MIDDNCVRLVQRGDVHNEPRRIGWLEKRHRGCVAQCRSNHFRITTDVIQSHGDDIRVRRSHDRRVFQIGNGPVDLPGELQVVVTGSGGEVSFNRAVYAERVITVATVNVAAERDARIHGERIVVPQTCQAFELREIRRQQTSHHRACVVHVDDEDIHVDCADQRIYIGATDRNHTIRVDGAVGAGHGQ